MILEELTMEGFKRGLRKSRTLIVPYGVVEAHGRHLPLNTDTLIIDAVVRKAAEMVPVFIAPRISYGVCTSTALHPGTVGIRPGTLRRLTLDIVGRSAEMGLKNFILISGHGGGVHLNAMREAAEALATGHRGLRIACSSIYELCGREIIAAGGAPDDSHAGAVETSLVMHIAPRLVDGTSGKEYPRFPRPFVVADKLKYWPGAVWGDPSGASRELGEKVFDVMVGSVVKLVKRAESRRPL